MAIIFKGNTEAIGFEDNKSTRLTFSPAGLPGVPDLSEEFWVTAVSGGVEPNYQLLYAFSNAIYVNAFAARLSLFELSGLYIPSKIECGTTSAVGDTSAKSPAFVQMYWEYNIVDANADPEDQKLLTVSFNQIVIRGFLVKLKIGEYSKERIDGHTFSLTMLGVLETGKFSKSDIAERQNPGLTASGNVAVAGGGIDAGGLGAGAAVRAAQNNPGLLSAAARINLASRS